MMMPGDWHHHHNPWHWQAMIVYRSREIWLILRTTISITRVYEGACGPFIKHERRARRPPLKDLK
jgi:hypothetical protein